LLFCATTGERVGLGVPHKGGVGRHEEEESWQNCVRRLPGGAGTIVTAKLKMLLFVLLSFPKNVFESFVVLFIYDT